MSSRVTSTGITGLGAAGINAPDTSAPNLGARNFIAANSNALNLQGSSGSASPPMGTAAANFVNNQMREGLSGVVLAGMHAWGECMLEEILTRPLWPIAGKPLIGHVLGWLGEVGVNRTCVCGNGHTHDLLSAVGRKINDSIAIEYYEDRMPRGPAGCARDAAMRRGDARFLVVDGTVIPDIDLDAMLAAHIESGAALTVAVTRLPAGGSGASADGVSPVGVYLFDRAALALVPPSGYQDIKESLIPKLVKEGMHIAAFEVDGRWAPRIRCPATYLAVNRWFLTRRQGERTADDYNDGPDSALATVHPTATVDASARLVGPIMVGARSHIGPGALIVGPTVIGEDCAIQEGAAVSRSVLWDRVRIDRRTVVDHCILTTDAVLESNLELRDSVLIPRTAQPRRSWRQLFARRESNGRKPVAYRFSPHA